MELEEAGMNDEERICSGKVGVMRRNKVKANHHSHSRKYRRNVGVKFVELAELVSRLSGTDKPRSKAEVLEACHALFREWNQVVQELEVQVAVSSRKSMHEWAARIASESGGTLEAAKSAARLICFKDNWKYAEVWTPIDGVMRLTAEVSNRPRANLRDSPWRAFWDGSLGYSFSRGQGMIGSTWMQMRPQWIPSAPESTIFLRAPLAKECGVSSCFAVVLMIDGEPAGILAFYDENQRGKPAESIELADFLTGALGNALTDVSSRLLPPVSSMEDVETNGSYVSES